MTEKWAGEYVYGEGYPEDIYGQAEPFSIEWINNDGVLTGTCTDDIVDRYYDRPATIQGFIEGDNISFIKKYPFLCTMDEAGNIIVKKDQPSAEIHYYGVMTDGHLEGEWEISAVYVTEEGRTMEYFCMGTWTLYKQ